MGYDAARCRFQEIFQRIFSDANCRFNTVVMDEACQAVEVASLVPLQYAHRSAAVQLATQRAKRATLRDMQRNVQRDSSNVSSIRASLGHRSIC